MKRVKLFKFIFLLSFAFLGYYLYGSDILSIPRLESGRSLMYSLLFLGVGFLLQAANWHQILKDKYPVSRRDAIISVGLSVFTKYIPGKIFVIVGKASYVHEKYGYAQKDMVSKSFDSQVLVIWLGLLLGGISLVWLGMLNQWGLLTLVAIGVLALFIFTPVFQKIINRLGERLFKSNFAFEHLGFRSVGKLLPQYALYWIILSIAFYFFLRAFSPQQISLLSGFTFPLAATFGIIAIFAPGGIGVREGILASTLHLSGMNLTEATSIAVASRLWFLFGEGMFFVTAIVCRLFDKRRNP